MRRGIRAVFGLALSVIFCLGCGRSAPDTRPDDERAIRAADAATLKAAQAKDIDGVTANYADDASWLPPNAPIVTGKAAIRAGRASHGFGPRAGQNERLASGD